MQVNWQVHTEFDKLLLLDTYSVFTELKGNGFVKGYFQAVFLLS